MAQAANIVLADAQATPVNHTFIPLGPDKNGVQWFEDQSQTNAIGYWRISAELKRTMNPAAGASSSNERVNRIKLALHEPVLETLGTADNGLTPPPTVAFVVRTYIEAVLPERCSLQNRKDIRKMSVGLLADAQIISMIENLIPVY